MRRMRPHRVAPDCAGVRLPSGRRRRPDARADRLSRHVSRARASLDAGRSHVSRDSAPAPLRARMSRSSPGRYAVHEFAKNVFSVEAFDGAGKRLTYTRPDVDGWDVAGHDGTVRLVYRIFGDHADGTYMAVDTTHAHLNMPAAFMWAAGSTPGRSGSRSCRRPARTGRPARSCSRRATRSRSPRRTCSTSWTARPSCPISS